MRTNNDFDAEISGFCGQLQRFCDACDAQEAAGTWDVEELGSMNAYFQAQLMGIALRLISADGSFERPEAHVLNRMFATSYDPADLAGSYHELGPRLEDSLRQELSSATTLLQTVDATMVERFRRLVGSACRVISAADGVAEGPEVELIAGLLAALEE